MRKKVYVEKGRDVWNEVEMWGGVGMLGYWGMKILGIGKKGDMEG